MGIDILFVHPLYGDATKERIFQPGVELPISLLYLAAYMDEQKISNDIVDLRLTKDPHGKLTDALHDRKPLVVGITSSTAALNNAMDVANRVKSFDSNIITVLGGWHASALPGETLQECKTFDYIIHGEGEVALTNFIQKIKANQIVDDCKGLAFRSVGGIRINPREKLIADLDSIPFPARDKVDVIRYHPEAGTRNYKSLPSTGILVGRGCPYKCLFCFKGVWGRGIRYRSPESVLQEIEICIQRYGVKDFRFYDDTVTFPRWDLKGLCEKIIEKKLNISWNCWSRVNDVNEEKLRLMKDAGCYHIKFGIEFGTEKALKLAGKGATLEQARQAVALCKKVGIECKGSFIFGIPGETEEDCRETLDFSLNISPDFATFYAFDPIPGSPFYEKIRKGEINPLHDILPKETSQKIADQAYRAFYLRPRFVMQRLGAFFRNPQHEVIMTMDGLRMIIAFWMRKMKSQSL